MSEPLVTIPRWEYDAMKRNTQILEALRNAGVDNWEWYDDAMASLVTDEYQ